MQIARCIMARNESLMHDKLLRKEIGRELGSILPL